MRSKLESNEEEWKEKQRIAEELLKLSSGKDSDEELLKNSESIAIGLKKLE